ncbi:23S rRNA (uracil-C(5))-methyltransferase RlmCD [Geobacillus sp. BCO2]|nr:23S rRNA (uracil-C(5))-methyltransferase RlmCD [Geobacillus sp. BCO2]
MAKQQMNIKIKKGEQFPVTIQRIGINGEGVGYFQKQVVFVPGALPGEEVIVEATDIHPTYAEAKIKRIRKRSPNRIKPPCPLYDQCGGCQLQHLSYEAQLEAKRDIVIQRSAAMPGASMSTSLTSARRSAWTTRGITETKASFKLE